MLHYMQSPSGGFEAATACQLLDSQVTHLDVSIDTFEKMLAGWDLQMNARNVKAPGRQQALALVRRFARFTNAYPWDWSPEDFEAWSADIIGRPDDGRAFATIRNYQGAIRRFNDYVTDPRYGWLNACKLRFGRAPTVICHEFNTYRHTDEFEGKPGRRSLTYEELQRFFDAADSLVHRARRLKRKGSLAAMRDGAMFKQMYAFGARRTEHTRVDLTDMLHQPGVPEWETFGALWIRYGKAKRGGPPRRRKVLLVPEFEWVVDVMRHYLEEVRPIFEPAAYPALWVTERCTRVSPTHVDEAFREIAREAALDPILEPHCLRHSFCTHLLEYDYPEIFVQRQMGHSWGSNTDIYSHVSNEFMNTQVAASIEERLQND